MRKLPYLLLLFSFVVTVAFFGIASVYLFQNPSSTNYNVPLDLSDRVLLVSGATVDPSSTAQLTLYQRPGANRSLTATPDNQEVSLTLSANVPLPLESLKHYPSDNPFATVYRISLPDDARYISIKIKTSGVVRGEAKVDEFGLLHREEDREVHTENEVLISRRDFKRVEALSDPGSSEHNLVSLKTHRDSLISLKSILAEQQSRLNDLLIEQANNSSSSANASAERTRMASNLELTEKSLQELEPRYTEIMTKLEDMDIEDPPGFLQDLLEDQSLQNTELAQDPTVLEAMTVFSMYKSLRDQADRMQYEIEQIDLSIAASSSQDSDPYTNEITELEETIAAWYETYGIAPGGIDGEIAVLEAQIQALEGK